MWIDQRKSVKQQKKERRSKLSQLESRVACIAGLMKAPKSLQPSLASVDGSIYLTGDPGAGKSFLAATLSQCNDSNVVVALLAASHQAGISLSKQLPSRQKVSTFDAWLFGPIYSEVKKIILNHRNRTTQNVSPHGINRRLGIEEMEDIYEAMVLRDLHTETRLTLPHVIILDEVSLITGEMIDLLDHVLKKANKTEKGFGGKKIIFVGDFLQLPPVDVEIGGWAFESDAWQSSVHVRVDLEGNKRLDFNCPHHVIFHQTLVHLRKGTVPPFAFLQELEKALSQARAERVSRRVLDTSRNSSDGDLLSLTLCSTKRELKHLASQNKKTDRKFALSKPRLHVCQAHSRTSLPECIDTGVSNLIQYHFIEDKVILTNTIHHNRVTYPSGTLGQIQSIDSKGIPTVVLGSERKTVVMQPSEIPIWEALPSEFERMSRTVFQWYFGNDRGCSDGEMCYVSMIPLLSGDGSTIHRVQGQTLEATTLYTGDIFAHGQAYVGASRVRTLSALRLMGKGNKEIRSAADLLDLFEKNQRLFDERVRAEEAHLG